MADSVRIPTNTVSLIILNLTFHTPLDDAGEPLINHLLLNDIYRTAAEGSQKGMLVYSDRQNVSSDLIGTRAAVVIEGHESHTRTGFIQPAARNPGRFRRPGKRGSPDPGHPCQAVRLV